MGRYRYSHENPPEWVEERDYADADWDEKRMENSWENERLAKEHEKIIQLKLWEAVAAINEAGREYAAMLQKDLVIMNNKAFAEAIMDVDKALFKLTEPDEKLQSILMRHENRT